MKKKNWWIAIMVLAVVGGGGVMYLGIRTYQDAPPRPDCVVQTASGASQSVVSHSSIVAGQEVFLKYNLMSWGSMFGDGAGKGPDFTADALHYTSQAMKDFYTEEKKKELGKKELSEFELDAIDAQVKKEIKRNHYDPATNTLTLTPGQAHAHAALVERYTKMFRDGLRDAKGNVESFYAHRPYIENEKELKDLASFFFWGGWVCGVERPGTNYSYTHNWPYDPSAGNLPTTQTTFWSVFGTLGFILGLGWVLYARGRMDNVLTSAPAEDMKPFCTEEDVARFSPTPTQRATYKFFVVAALLFVVQMVAGLLAIHEFVEFSGLDIGRWLPITISRGWHVQLALLWIASCWIAASIFVLPMMTGSEPAGQVKLVNFLFGLLVVMTVGSLAGIALGPMNVLGSWWNFLGNQGWEFVEEGKLWQMMLYAALVIWAVIIYRGITPFLKGKDPWALPNWLFYTVVCVVLLLTSGFVARPDTNFAVADFWRWMVIHMWVEAFLEVFTTVVVAYNMYLMGLVSFQSATRLVYLATILFLGSGLLGISHNFYWNAKPEATLAVGSIFSTLQVVPLILLTLEAWRLRNSPKTAQQAFNNGTRKAEFGQSTAFLYLLGVTFWNFMGAGVFGLIINLPIVNYYEHGTYLTVNHGHTAFMGVYGNLSLAGMLFCGRYLIAAKDWSDRLMRCAFWSLNIGLALMAILDLFPVGVLQFKAVLDEGFWWARSPAFIMDTPFVTLTMMRGVGVALFIFGGVLPLAWFMTSRTRSVKPATNGEVPDLAVEGLGAQI